MTANASRLTVSATPATRRAGSDAMQPASHLGVFVDALDRLGYDVTALLGAVGLRRRDLDDPAAAERLLTDASLAVGEVGYLLGFSEPSAFHRAFRRWHDMTPAAFRGRTRPS